MKTVGIIQARLGSTRLPNKMLLSLHGHPIIEWVLRRIEKSKRLDDIIVAIPDSVENNLLEMYILKYNHKVFRGSEEDVLGRFYGAAQQEGATHIVRICADNPLIDPKEIDNLIEFYKAHPCDYAYNHIPKGNKYPDGLGAEIISGDLLADIHERAGKARYREHCFSYITDHPDKFQIKTFDPSDKKLWHPEMKFDIDTFDDYFYMHNCLYTIQIESEGLINLFKNKKY